MCDMICLQFNVSIYEMINNIIESGVHYGAE